MLCRCVYELASFFYVNRETDRRLTLFSLKWPSLANPFKSRKLSEEEEQWFTKFSCRDAQCYKPSDRALLLHKIRTEWGSEENFDTFVRTRLLQVMAESKERYQGQLWRVIGQSISLVLGD